jgi:hypothetical protein
VNELGHPSLRFEDIAAPEPGADQVRIQVEAGTINFADILLCQGIYQDRPGLPFTPGLETCGVVEAVGPGVALALGTRIAGLAALPAGGYAEQALVRAPTALVIPERRPRRRRHRPQLDLRDGARRPAPPGRPGPGRVAARPRRVERRRRRRRPARGGRRRARDLLRAKASVAQHVEAVGWSGVAEAAPLSHSSMAANGLGPMQRSSTLLSPASGPCRR